MPQSHSGSRRPNLLVVTILGLSAGMLYVCFDPLPAGESPPTTGNSEQTAFPIVPLPPNADSIPAGEGAAGDESGDGASAIKCGLTNRETLKFCLLMLKDGIRLLNSVDTYTATFHKQERIGGDLSEVQAIDLKVRHFPKFAVYMNWRNGDRGRQLLYNKQYEDGDMVVKLGGLKGRLLPGIKLNPHGSMATSESRYPVTNAGILGMLKQIVAHREHDLVHDHAVSCQRLRNQPFDGHDCYCFLFVYNDPDISTTYRKSIILIDAVRHIPLMARNYTWATDCDDMPAEELDELTLIEGYSFTAIDFAEEVLAIEFSRDNPRYRM